MKTLIAAALFALPLAGAVGLALSDDDDHDHEAEHPDLAPAEHPAYLQECGACHLAYPPSLLPARSWNRILDTLDDHFGDNAELGAGESEAIRDYLQAQAADRSDGRRGRAIAASLAPAQTPLRISETPWFQRQHHEIPPRMLRNNPELSSFGQCQACHRGAEAGSYDEHQVRIPGYGHWDD